MNMSYKNLPVGRLRRLSYSNYIRSNIRNRHNTDNTDNQYQIHFELENDIELNFHSRLTRTSPETFIEGEDFTNLIDIKKGRNLVENSNVKIFNDNTVYLNLICGICRDQFIEN